MELTITYYDLDSEGNRIENQEPTTLDFEHDELDLDRDDYLQVFLREYNGFNAEDTKFDYTIERVSGAYIPEWMETSFGVLREHLENLSSLECDNLREAYYLLYGFLGYTVSYVKFHNLYCGMYTSAEAFAEEWFIDDCVNHGYDLPPHVRNLMDWGRAVKELKHDDYVFCPTSWGGVAVFKT